MEKIRCPWCGNADGADRRYHDQEWGVPLYGDRGQFEFLTLEAAQAGLSWNTILRKRAGYRACFADFAPEKMADFTEKDVERLLADASIVRNRKKIEAAVNNARRFLEVAAEYGSFSNYFWRFSDGRPVRNAWSKMEQVPVTTPLSDLITRDLKARGFRFLGSTVVYAHMQATGMVNDHLISCFRHAEVSSLALPGAL